MLDAAAPCSHLVRHAERGGPVQVAILCPVQVAILCLVPDPYTVSAEKDRAGQACRWPGGGWEGLGRGTIGVTAGKDRGRGQGRSKLGGRGTGNSQGQGKQGWGGKCHTGGQGQGEQIDIQ